MANMGNITPDKRQHVTIHLEDASLRASSMAVCLKDKHVKTKCLAKNKYLVEGKLILNRQFIYTYVFS